MTVEQHTKGSALLSGMEEAQRLSQKSRARRANMPDTTPEQAECIRELVDEQLFFQRAYDLLQQAFEDL